MHNYSTHFYRTKAIDIITNHDQSTPLFLYLPFQAVHDPFTDAVESRDNARSMISDEIRDAIDKNVVGHKRTDYAYALNLLDGAVGAIKRALDETGLMDNTYLIFGKCRREYALCEYTICDTPSSYTLTYILCNAL